ncbi:MAG: hypothetical protein ACI9CD_000198 [Candidatus Deianiraeaceae bacterium]|jgi:hypothetical protein
MQKLFSEIPFGKYFIPFSAHIDNHTVISKSGLISQTIKISPSIHIDFRHNIISTIQKMMTPDILVNIHTIHSEYSDHISVSFVEYLKMQHTDYLSSHNAYRHTFYITISIPGYNINKSNIIHFLLRNRFLMEVNRSVKTLHNIVHNFCDEIKQYHPKVLSLFLKNDIAHSQNNAFLYNIIFGVNSSIPIADMEISEQIKPASIKHYKNYITLKRKSQKQFLSCLTIKDFPIVASGEIVKIFTSTSPFIMSQTIHCSQNSEVKALFEYQKKITNTIRNNDISQICSWDNVIDSDQTFAIQTNILLYGHTTQEMEEGVAGMDDILSNIGLVVIREDINVEQAFYASLPANPTFLNRIEYGTTSHIGQFLLSKNMLFSGIEKIKHFPFLPLVATSGQKYALSPFTPEESHHVLIHGIPNTEQHAFVNTLLVHISENSNVICLDSHYSSLALNKIKNGKYLPHIQVNILNLLAKNTTHFLQFLTHFLQYFCKKTHAPLKDVISEARAFSHKIKSTMTFQQLKSLTSHTVLQGMLDFAKEMNFFEEEDMLENNCHFLSINTTNLDNETYSLVSLYILLANLHKTSKMDIIKMDRSFDTFNTHIIPQPLLINILRGYQERHSSIIACCDIPESFEKNRTFNYADVYSAFSIGVFMESTCGAAFTKLFFQLNSKVGKHLMFIKGGSKKAAIRSDENIYTVKLEDTMPVNKLSIFNPHNKNFKNMLQTIEGNKNSAHDIILEYQNFIKQL